MTTLDDREQQTLTKRCTKCGEVKALEAFPPDKRRRDGRDSRCHACHTKRVREARWKEQGIPESEWPRLHKEADRKAEARTDHKAEARADRRDSVPDGFKRCPRCAEAKPLEEFPLDKGKQDGRDSRCRVCNTKRVREARWKEQGIPESEWPRLHKEADRKAEARTDRKTEARTGRKTEARTDRPVERRHIMRELAKQHGLKYCPDCDMCLGRAFFHRDSARADGLFTYCKACTSARHAAYYRTDEGRAVEIRRAQRRRAKIQGLPTDGTGPRDWAAWAEEQDDFLCNLCGGMLTAEDDIHYDHVDPISTGTTGTVLHNMRAVHAWCNLSRGNRPIDEWRAAMGLSDEIP